MILWPDPMAPGGELTEDQFKSLVNSVRNPPGERMKALERRWDFLRGAWLQWLHAFILRVHKSPVHASEVKNFASVSLNLPQIVTTALATVYKVGARRYIDEDASADEVMREVWQDARIQQKCSEWNRTAWFCGPTLVLPRLTAAGDVRYTQLAPHMYDVILDPSDPLHAAPLAAAWKVQTTASGAAIVVLDAERYYYLDRTGGLIGSREHGLGVFPGVVFRAWEPPPDDYWDIARLRFLEDGGLLIAYFWARLHMRRKQQDARAPVIVGNSSRLPPGQALVDGEHPLVIDIAGGESVTVESLDMDTSPEHAIQHIREILDRTVEQLGLPANAVTYDVGGPHPDVSMATTVAADRLAQIRGDQIPFFRAAERELAIKTAALLGGRVSVESVAAGFRIEFPDVSRTDDPKMATELEDWELKHFLIDDVALVMRRHPEMDREQAEAYLLANLESRARIAQMLASRNLVLDISSGVMSTPEVLGRLGGQGQNNDRPTAGGSDNADGDDATAE